jgi:hypothetical protein
VNDSDSKEANQRDSNAYASEKWQNCCCVLIYIFIFCCYSEKISSAAFSLSRPGIYMFHFNFLLLNNFLKFVFGETFCFIALPQASQSENLTTILSGKQLLKCVFIMIFNFSCNVEPPVALDQQVCVAI